jgi:DNA-binding MarR family transcriptional regulator
MTASPTRGHSQTDRSAKEVWGRLLNLVMATEARRDLLVARLGLTSGDGRALMSLDSRTVRTMGSLAGDWRCDASTATRAVDRLESRRLAERRSVAGDRRVRGVALTPIGVHVKAKLTAGLMQPPPDFSLLSAAEVSLLLDATRPLPNAIPPVPSSPAWKQPQRGLEIRTLAPGDEEQVLAAAPLFSKAPLPEATERLLLEPGHHFLIAYQDGTPAGFIVGIEQLQPDKGIEMFISQVAVDSQWRGRGIGRFLIESLLAIARERRCYGMWALTQADDLGSLTTYGRAGASSQTGQVILSWKFD